MPCNYARLVRDLAAAPHQTDRLLDQRRQIRKLDLARVQRGFEILVQIRRRRAAHLIPDPETLEVAPERLAGIGVAMDRGDAV